MKNNRKGFTLVELLVVIAIIGLLATIAFLSLNRARSKARDAKRVSDIRTIQSALELYYNDQTTPLYPAVEGETYPQTASAVNTALSATYLATFPTAPTPVDDPPDGTNCSAAPDDTDGKTYRYEPNTSQATGAVATPCISTDANCGSWYTMSFCIGGATGGLAAGCLRADPSGITTAACI